MNIQTRKVDQKQTLKIICLSSFLFVVFLLEYFNRDSLIHKSMHFSKTYNDFKNSHINLVQRLIMFGCVNYTTPIMLFFFLLFPINKSYTLLCAMIYSSYIDNCLKLIYGAPSPCETSDDYLLYFTKGNEAPSSTTLRSTCIFLSLWHLFFSVPCLKFSRRGRISKFLFLLFILILVIAISLSEVLLLQHSFNKVIYGICFGFGIYYLLFIQFALHNMTAKEFFRLFKHGHSSMVLKLTYGVQIIFICALYYLLQKENNFLEPLLIVTREQTQYGDTALLKGLSIITLIGAFYGLQYLYEFSLKYFPQKYNEINNWNKVKLKGLAIITIILTFFSFGLIIYTVIPMDSPFEVVIIIKICFPYFIISYALCGPAIASCIMLYLANSHIYESKGGFSAFNEAEEIEMRLTDNVIIV